MMRAISQRRLFDCGVACVAMFCHVAYEDAYVAAVHVVGPSIRGGINVKEIQAIAKRFACPLRRVDFRKVDLEEDSGILGILFKDAPTGHWVVLRRGTIIEPDPIGPKVWDADVYMSRMGARPATLLVEA